jgi:hypothetical protein
MTDEQKAAYVMAQAALLNAKIAAMVNANTFERPGDKKYTEADFDAVIQDFQVLNHNYLIGFFHST